MTNGTELNTQRLHLRTLGPDDWAAVYAFRSDAEALKFEPWGPESEAHVRQSLAAPVRKVQQQLAGGREWGITLRADGHLIGSCKLTLPIPELDKWGWATLGYVLQRKFWGQGYAKEAMTALVSFAATQPFVLGVNAICDSQNIASLRVLEHCGLQRVGMIAETERVKGRFRDMLKYEKAFKRW